MSTNPQNLLELAKSINGLGGESGYRSAVSRSYYAGYHQCKTWQATLPGVASSGGGPAGGVHQQLINQLYNPAPEVKCLETRKLSKVLSSRLSTFKQQRVTADYFLNENAPYKDWANNVIAGVELMFEMLQAAGQPESKTSEGENLPQMPAPSSETEGVLIPALLPEVTVRDAEVMKRPALKRVK